VDDQLYPASGRFYKPKDLFNVLVEFPLEIGCPYREEARDKYRVTVGYCPSGQLLAAGHIKDLAEDVAVTLKRAAGEVLAARILEVLQEAIPGDPEVRVTLNLENSDGVSLFCQAESGMDKTLERRRQTPKLSDQELLERVAKRRTDG
jgi:hypothetical protein